MLIEIAFNNNQPIEQAGDSEPAGKPKTGFDRKRKYRTRMREEPCVRPREIIPIEESESGLCVALWRSVVVQALYDISGKNDAPDHKLLRAESLAWFAGSGRKSESSFEYVCGLADLCPEHVRGIVRNLRDSSEDIMSNINFRTVRKDYSNRLNRRVPKKVKTQA